MTAEDSERPGQMNHAHPMTLYRAKRSRAIVVFVVLVALKYIEMFVLGTTVGF